MTKNSWAMCLVKLYLQKEMEYAQQYFQEHYNEDIQIKDYAKSRSMSVSWFLRNFKKFIGQPPAQYLLTIRMNNAVSLLETTDYNVAEISAIIGYDNALYFSRLFKKHKGVSPSEYRRLFQKKNSPDRGIHTCRRCDGELFLGTEFEIEEVASPEGVVAADVVCAVAACTGGCVVDIAAHERVGYEFIGQVDRVVERLAGLWNHLRPCFCVNALRRSGFPTDMLRGSASLTTSTRWRSSGVLVFRLSS